MEQWSKRSPDIYYMTHFVHMSVSLGWGPYFLSPPQQGFKNDQSWSWTTCGLVGREADPLEGARPPGRSQKNREEPSGLKVDAETGGPLHRGPVSEAVRGGHILRGIQDPSSSASHFPCVGVTASLPSPRPQQGLGRGWLGKGRRHKQT